jgi:hypothetical protein
MLTIAALAPSVAMNGPLMLPPPIRYAKQIDDAHVNTNENAGDELIRKSQRWSHAV